MSLLKVTLQNLNSLQQVFSFTRTENSLEYLSMVGSELAD